MKVIKIWARELEAGDRIVIREGRINKSYPVVEVHKWRYVNPRRTLVSYIYKARGGEWVHVEHVKGKTILTVRDD